ncbi:NADH-quinone oxidoreductase subunit J family protein [Planctomicrobium piriforme]|uniref:NADH-quinone oxidoreductase subunit J n=1 Tax=Planctomicrobium piriforme TaxID=1576369 RepID=A0A1I3QSE5_9PLAN|nr:NADH-quinone oxidoreductase subunit J [Planctomicrobium piriforme]SFJ36449.1 NADH-quinone oxidoreductase subunit J [Planctomicrobium piriforme]
MNWMEGRGLFLISLTLIAVGVMWLLPRRAVRSKAVGLALVVLGGIGQGFVLRTPASPIVYELMFWFLAGSALFFGVLTITSRNPIYGALWFALTTLATCGLFIRMSAPFLAAATIIVYAGAIIVTFVFVIMLAQQAGCTAYDQRSRRPILATISGFVLLAAVLTVLHQSSPVLVAAVPPAVGSDAEVSNPLSRPKPGETLGTMHGVGRSLFGDYLFEVEVAGTLLLVASIGAIAIAPRREQGTL